MDRRLMKPNIPPVHHIPPRPRHHPLPQRRHPRPRPTAHNHHPLIPPSPFLLPPRQLHPQRRGIRSDEGVALREGFGPEQVSFGQDDLGGDFGGLCVEFVVLFCCWSYVGVGMGMSLFHFLRACAFPPRC